MIHKGQIKIKRLILSGKLVTNHLDRRVELYSLKNFWWVTFNVMQLLSYLKNTSMTSASSSILKCTVNVTLAFNNMMLMHVLLYLFNVQRACYYFRITTSVFIPWLVFTIFIHVNWFQIEIVWISSIYELHNFTNF